ncbi:MAG: Gfo/Idh/MocA family oxidoreductase [Clostridia bacterium]|nr:Gfo/Idh/MocA family oxidoreductase [Clostridia bacterium]
MKRLVIVGASFRGYTMFADKIFKNHGDCCRIVGVYDPNYVRSEYYRDTTFKDMKVYDDFDVMLDAEKPDGVIVTTVDRFHHEYIIKALDAGYDVYSEKPMTTTEDYCLAIREAEKRSGKRVTVTFNCRFMPYYAKVKELVASGIIGKPLAINYNYVLNTVHGGDYFKRWHRFLENSGGMMVHKATHHFDVVNWILDDEPVSVSAQGARLFFGQGERPYSDEGIGERCSTCQHAEGCPNFQDHTGEGRLSKALYFDAEHVDGYVRDHCPYKTDTDIYDLMSVSVSYKKGAILNYNLTLFDTREGYTINIIGEKGAIEASTFFECDDYKVVVRYRTGETEEIHFPKAEGTHAGGDDRLIAMLFGDEDIPDTLGQCSDSFDGVKSAMIGIAANRSIKTGERVYLTPVLDKMR